MKEYHAEGWIYRLPLYIVAPFALLTDCFSDVFPWAYDVFFILLGAGCVFYLVTPFKFFPVFTTLCIDEACIRKRLFETYTTRCISRGKARIGYLILHGIRYVVFSEEDIPAEKRDILRLVYLRRALLFPYNYEMHKDFPELFDDNEKGKSYFIQ